MSKKVVVAGAGVIGLCSAYSLARRGADVVVVDAAEPGAGASWGNAGWITPFLSGPLPAAGVIGDSVRWMLRPNSPLFIKPRVSPSFVRWLAAFWRSCNNTSYSQGLLATAEFARPSMELFDRLHEDGVDFEYHRDGLLFLFTTKRGLDEKLASLELMLTFGYEPKFFAVPRYIEPSLRDDLAGGLWIEQERQVRPDTLIAGLTKKLKELNVDILSFAEVRGFDLSGGNVSAVRANGTSIPCEAVLISTGAWAPRLTRQLGVRIPIEAGKGYSIDYSPSPVRLARSLYLYESRVAVTPFDGFARVAGTMELSGLNTKIVPARVEAMTRATARYLDGWPQGNSHKPAWTGMRPMAPDGLPILGRLPGTKNAFVATGHAMLGVTLGPATGEAMAELILEGIEPDVLKPFDPTRFQSLSRTDPLI